MKLTPASTEALMRASAPAWSTLPMCFQMPEFSPIAAGSSPAKVMAPRHIWETRRPVLPRVLYCMDVLWAEKSALNPLDAEGRLDDSRTDCSRRGTSLQLVWGMGGDGKILRPALDRNRDSAEE